MKKLVRLVILGAILCPIISIAISCSEEADCSMTARPMVNCILYRVDPETQYVENDTLDSLTVTAYGTDSIIINNQKKVHDISLPLRYTEDSTKLIFKYSRTKSDTMVIRHTNTPYFLSMDCGYQMKQASMERKILSYSISLALCLLMFLPLRAQNGNPTVPPQGAPPKKEKKDAKEEVHYPLYNGMSVGLDLWGIGSSVFGGDFLSSEVAVDVNLKNRFFPIAELGYGSTDTWSDKGIHYKSNAPYFRIGMDYNTLYKKQHGHMLLVGLRYGVSSFKYDVDALGLDDPIYGGIVGNPNLDDEIWGGSLPYNHKGMKGSMQWAEFCVGIRAHVWKALYMGWSLRFKFKLSASADEYGDPWYVPGFGKYGSNTMGVTYTITYKLPL